jgi:phosphopantetheinyl transferase
VRFSVDVQTNRRARRYARLRSAVLTPRARWTVHRKADACMALAGGVVSRAELQAAHSLTGAEIDEWMAAARGYGVTNRRATSR